MKAKKRITNDNRLQTIFIHFQPRPRGGYVRSTPQYKAMMAGIAALSKTPPGQRRNKEQDAYQAERDWQRNLSFVAGLYNLIPANSSVLKLEAETLLLKMFGRGFDRNTLERFNTAERQRITKNGEAAWRLVEKLRKHYGPPD